MYSKQRLTLFGHLETLKELNSDDQKVQDCYLTYHPDATHFVPGSKDSPHLAIWTRFIVDRVYRVGGYGDESQIGWLDLERWQQAGQSMKGQPLGIFNDNSKAEMITPSNSERLVSLFGDSFVKEPSAGLVFQA